MRKCLGRHASVIEFAGWVVGRSASAFGIEFESGFDRAVPARTLDQGQLWGVSWGVY